MNRYPLIFLLLSCTIASIAHENITFVTTDSITIHGDWYAASDKSQGVLILLHMNRSNRTLWKPFAEEAVAANLSVLAIDFRGHGESTQSASTEITFESLTNDDYAKMVNDVAEAVHWIASRPENQRKKIAIIGASIGANVALEYAIGDPSIVAVALISPGEDYRGLMTIPALKSYQDRPCLIISSEDDNYSSVSSQKLAALNGKETELFQYQTGGHGTHLFESHTDLSDRLIQFILANLSQN